MNEGTHERHDESSATAGSARPADIDRRPDGVAPLRERERGSAAVARPSLVTGTARPIRGAIAALALPALLVLAAEPLYVLVDTAVVGHLGRIPLAALAIGGG